MIHRLFAEGAAAGEFVCADPAGAAARLSALRDGLAIQQTLFGGGQSPDVFIDEFRGGICNELGLSRAEYDRLARDQRVKHRAAPDPQRGARRR